MLFIGNRLLPVFIGLFVISVFLLPGPVSAGCTTTAPVCCGGGSIPSLSDLYPDLHVETIEHIPIHEGQNDLGNGFVLDAIYQGGDWKFFSFTSTKPVSYVLVHSEMCYWVYNLTGESRYGKPGELFHAPDSSGINCLPMIHGVSYAYSDPDIPEDPDDPPVIVVPEFPTALLPAGMLIGMISVVLMLRRRT